MKKIILAAFAVCTFAAIEGYSADAASCMNSCAVNSNVDSGNTAKRCSWDNTSCSCESKSCHPWYLATSTCALGDTNYGTTVTGKKCCHQTEVECPRDGNARRLPAPDSSVQLSQMAEEELAHVMNADMDGRTTSYFGVVNLVNRSPNAGRANALWARLDICMGHANTDSADDSYPACLSKCGDGGSNDKCTSNSNEVCIDRCECAHSQGTCDGL